MDAAIAIISVLSSAAVAIVVAVVANRGETTRLEFQISAERLNELRAVLDEAASALKGALFEMNGVVSLLDQGLEQALGDGPTVNDLYAEFHLDLRAEPTRLSGHVTGTASDRRRPRRPAAEPPVGFTAAMA